MRIQGKADNCKPQIDCRARGKRPILGQINPPWLMRGDFASNKLGTALIVLKTQHCVLSLRQEGRHGQLDANCSKAVAAKSCPLLYTGGEPLQGMTHLNWGVL